MLRFKEKDSRHLTQPFVEEDSLPMSTPLTTFTLMPNSETMTMTRKSSVNGSSRHLKEEGSDFVSCRSTSSMNKTVVTISSNFMMEMMTQVNSSDDSVETRYVHTHEVTILFVHSKKRGSTFYSFVSSLLSY